MTWAAIILVIMYVNDSSGQVEAITSRYDLSPAKCEAERDRLSNMKPHKSGIHLVVNCTDVEPDLESLKKPLRDS